MRHDLVWDDYYQGLVCRRCQANRYDVEDGYAHKEYCRGAPPAALPQWPGKLVTVSRHDFLPREHEVLFTPPPKADPNRIAIIGTHCIAFGAAEPQRIEWSFVSHPTDWTK